MKKKLLAGLLSLTMLTGQMLPVVAADDAEVTVSEDVVYEEEGAEEDGNLEIEGEAIEIEVPDEEPVAGEGEEFVYTAVTPTAEELDKILESIAAGEDVEVIEGETVDAPSATQIYVRDRIVANVVAESIDINGKTYPLSAEVAYYSGVNYRGRKIKADTDLFAQAASADLYAVAADMVGTGADLTGLIKVTFSAKKNKAANGGAYFTIKTAVDKKVAKSLGLKGKPLKNLKKAIKKFNKGAKAAKLSFTIDPLVTDQLLANDALTIIYVTTYRWGIPISTKYSHIRVRIDASQPEYSSSWKKWTKLSNKEFKIVKRKEGSKYNYNLTPKGKNVIGMDLNFTL